MNGLALWIAQRLAGARRFGLPRGEPGTEPPLVLEHVLALDPRRRLCLVRCGRHRLLLLTGGAQDVSLGFLPPEPAL